METKIADFKAKNRYTFYAMVTFQDDVIKTKGTDYMQKLIIMDESITDPIEYRIFSTENISANFEEGDFVYLRKTYVHSPSILVSNRSYGVEKLCNVYNAHKPDAMWKMNENEKKRMYAMKDHFYEYIKKKKKFKLFDELVGKQACSFIGHLKFIRVESNISTLLTFVDYTTHNNELNIVYLRNWDKNAAIAKDLEVDAFYWVENVYVMECGSVNLLKAATINNLSYVRLALNDFRMNEINARMKLNHDKKKSLQTAHKTQIKVENVINTDSPVDLHQIYYKMPVDVYTIKLKIIMYYRMPPVVVDSLVDLLSNSHEVCTIKKNLIEIDKKSMENSKTRKKYNPLAMNTNINKLDNLAHENNCNLDVKCEGVNSIEEYENIFLNQDKEDNTDNDKPHFKLLVSDGKTESQIITLLPDVKINENTLKKYVNQKSNCTCEILKDTVNNKVFLYLCKII